MRTAALAGHCILASKTELKYHMCYIGSKQFGLGKFVNAAAHAGCGM
jgi:hypothetical protein